MKRRWKKCEEGWWDLVRGTAYLGWSVAQQRKVKFINGKLIIKNPGWYVFNDLLRKQIGPFKSSLTAKRACPI